MQGCGEFMVLWGMAAAAAAVGKLFLSDAIGAIATERFCGAEKIRC